MLIVRHMFSFRSDDIDDWSTMRIQFDELVDFFSDFDENSDEISAIFDELEDIRGSEIPTSSFLGFESLYSQYIISATTELYLSSVEQGLEGDDYELTITQPRKIARKKKDSQKKRLYRSKLFPKKRPLCDIITSNNDVKIIAELSGVSKEDVKVRVLDGGIVNIVVRKGNTKKYDRKVRIPAAEVDMDSGRSKLNNGILEITFNKKKKTKSAQAAVNHQRSKIK